MASRISELIVKIGAQTGDFKNALAQTTRELESSAAKLTNIGTTFGVGLSAPILGLGAAAVRSFGEIDALKRGLVTVSKSAEEAEKQFADLREVAKLPGLGFKEAVQGAVNLRAVGFSAAESSRILGEFGNALAGVGRGKEDLNEVIRQLGQLSSRGKVTADNLKPIIERVPQAAGIIRKEFGTIDTEALQKMGVDSDRFIKVLLDGLSQLPRATGGIKNEMENLRDTTEIALAQIGQAVAPVATQFIQASSPIISTVGDIASAFQSLPKIVQNGTFALIGIAAAAGPIALAAAGVVRMRSAIVDLLKLEFAQAIIVQFTAIRTAALGATTAVGGVQAALGAIAASSAGTAIAAIFTPLGIAIAGIALHLDGIRKAWRELKAEMDNDAFLKTLLRRFPEMTSAAKQAATDLGFFARQSDDAARAALNLSFKQAETNKALKGALATLGVKAPSAELQQLKAALESVQGAYKRGEVDIGTLNRATEAYGKQVKALRGELEQAKQFSFQDFVREEVFSRITSGWNTARDAVADFTTASYNMNAQLKLVASSAEEMNPIVDTLGAKLKTAFRDPISEILKLNAELVTLQANADIANRILTANSRSPVRNLPLPGTVGTDERMRGAGIDTQGDLRRKADELGDIWQQVDAEVKAGTRSAQDAKRAYEEWTEAEKRAAGITGDRARQSGKAWQGLGRQVSTIVTDLSRGISDIIFEGGKVGEVFQKIGIDIGKSITRYAIEKGVNLLIDSLGKLLGKVIDVGGAFGKVFGGGASAAGGIGSAAGGIGGAIGSGGSAAGTATSALSSAVGLVGAIGSAVTAVFSGLQYLNSRRMEQDIGRIEVTSRSIMNDLANLRSDEWSRFNSNWLRLGEILTAVRSIYDGLSQVNFSALNGLQPATQTAGGVVFNGPVTFEVTANNVDELMEGITRRLKLVDNRFSRA